MRYLTIDDTYVVIFSSCRYTGSLVKADPDTAALAHIITTPVGELKLKIAARHEATDLVADAQGVVAFYDRVLKEGVLAVSRKAFAHFASRTASGYLKILPKAATDIVKLPQVERKKAISVMVDALGEKGLPVELAQQGKDLTVGLKNRDAAQAGVDKAELNVTKARTAEAEARDAVLVAYRTLHAQLTLKFPNDKPRVESYFRSPVVKKAKVAVVAG